MARFIFLQLLFFTTFSSLYAQEDSTSVEYSEENGRFMNQKFLDEYDYIFGTKEVTKQLFKINIASLSPTLSISGDNLLVFKLNMDYERKLGKSFSINTLVTPYFSVNNSGLSENVYRKGIRIGLEPRWYYKMNQAIKTKKRADNLSGIYASLLVETDKSEPLNPAITNFADWSLLARYGVQSRCFKYGFVDMSIGVGAAYRNKSVELFYDDTQTAYIRIKRDWQPLLSAQAKIGLALGGGQNQSGGKYCDAFKCLTEENRLLKIDLLNLVKEFNNQLIVSKGSVAYEHRLGNSPISVNTELKAAYTRDKSISNVPNTLNIRQDFQRRFELVASIEPRYYYNLRRRMAMGKSANNFSANYVTVVSEYFYENDRTNYLDGIVDAPLALQKQGFRFTPCWGIQRHLFSRGFIDYRLGLGRAYNTKVSEVYCSKPNVCTTRSTDPYWQWILKSELKIGLAF